MFCDVRCHPSRRRREFSRLKRCRSTRRRCAVNNAGHCAPCTPHASREHAPRRWSFLLWLSMGTVQPAMFCRSILREPHRVFRASRADRPCPPSKLTSYDRMTDPSRCLSENLQTWLAVGPGVGTLLGRLNTVEPHWVASYFRWACPTMPQYPPIYAYCVG